MTWLGRLWKWLRRSDRPIGAGVALVSLIVALLSSLAAVVQAALLFGQLWTPYRTALYVRQLEIAGDFNAAAHEQWAAIIDLRGQCQRRLDLGMGDEADYWKLSERFRTGSTTFHNAYSAAIATFPARLHYDALQIWDLNERIVENVVNKSSECGAFIENFDAHNTDRRANVMNESARALVDDMRLLLRVDRWTRTDLEHQRRLREEARQREPGIKVVRRKLPPIWNRTSD
jgi:hypothetical protein